MRPFRKEDAGDLFELNSDPEVLRYTGDPPFDSIKQAEEFVANYDHYEKHGYGRWAVIKKEDDKFIGWCGLKLNEQNHIDIGFRFSQNEWGKGYATEAAKATMLFGFNTLGMKEIIARAAEENKASLRVIEKLGMEFWKKDESKGIEDSLYFRKKITE